MPRPFRFEPPSPPFHPLVRPRLLSRLRKRWDRRLTGVVAGPGFGKTALLVAAIADEHRPEGGKDHWLSCEPADESAEHLVAALGEALGLASPCDTTQLVDGIWSRAPDRVVLVLDDVHEIPDGSAGAQLLERLVEELPGNAHLVMASRRALPVRTARLAAAGRFECIDEATLTLDAGELADFAEARGVEPELLAATAGWPALAELAASAGQELVVDYLWEEVLSRIGEERARLLSAVSAVGAADDTVVSALAGRPVTVDEVIADVPLVSRTESGWVSPHALWEPALRRVLGPAERNAARLRAAQVHLSEQRWATAIELLVEAEAWSEVVKTLRSAEMHLMAPVSPQELGRWARMLPPTLRGEPEALLATGLQTLGSDPMEAVELFGAAREGFNHRDDIDGESAAIAQESLVRWWTNDIGPLIELVVRLDELGEAGAPLGKGLAKVGAASAAHLAGDSQMVFEHLAGVGDDLPAGWSAVARWLRSAAHRRNGQLHKARRELEVALTLSPGRFGPTLDNAGLQIAWLEGEVDVARRGSAAQRASHDTSGDSYLERETSLELAHRAAWLGDLETGMQMLASGTALLPDVPSSLVDVLSAVARAAIAVGHGDESAAASAIEPQVNRMLGTHEAWYLRDRAAVALSHVLLPGCRNAWRQEQLGPAHRPGIELAEALEAAREGDLGPVRELDWPEVGVVRAHLPQRWVVELGAAGRAAGNPLPGLQGAIGTRLRHELAAVAASDTHIVVRSEAESWAAELPAVPAHRVDVGVLGPFEVRLDEEVQAGADQRRRRVRELLGYLVENRRVRREAVAEVFWGEMDDPARNLRVTLSYLQRVLQPSRDTEDPPYFVRSDGVWLELTGDEEHLGVDLWALEAHLDDGAAADRKGSPGAALEAYRTALQLWRGMPFEGFTDAPWVLEVQARIVPRFVNAAVRAGELLLASRHNDEALEAAHVALSADRWHEPAHQLLIRAHLAVPDRSAALRAQEACRSALAELDLEPDPSTVAMLEPGD